MEDCLYEKKRDLIQNIAEWLDNDDYPEAIDSLVKISAKVKEVDDYVEKIDKIVQTVVDEVNEISGIWNLSNIDSAKDIIDALVDEIYGER